MTDSVTCTVCGVGASGVLASGLGCIPDTEAWAGVGVHARGEEISSSNSSEGKCGAACVKFLTFVSEGPSGKFMAANNASLSVIAFRTTVNGVVVHVVYGTG